MDKVREKYHKIKTLVDQGATEGERQAATLALQRMEKAHPQLKELPHNHVTGRFKSFNEATIEFSKAVDHQMEELVRQAFMSGITRMDIDLGTDNIVTSAWQRNADGTWRQIK